MTAPRRTVGNIFDDLGLDPAEAEILKVKSALMNSIVAYMDKTKLTQHDAAEIMGVDRARISDVSRGNISKFTIDMLLAMNARAGLHPLTIAA
ncbi:MAG: XRE family transcriptional regulator [Pseudomonadales bacterium]